MLLALQTAELITDIAQQDQVQILFESWQLPMYRIEFAQIEVSLEDLRADQDAMLWREMGS